MNKEIKKQGRYAKACDRGLYEAAACIREYGRMMPDPWIDTAMIDTYIQDMAMTACATMMR